MSPSSTGIMTSLALRRMTYLREGLRPCDIAEQNHLAVQLCGKSEKLDQAIAAPNCRDRCVRGESFCCLQVRPPS